MPVKIIQITPTFLQQHAHFLFRFANQRRIHIAASIL